MHPHDDDSRFILQTGDVVNLDGSRAQYYDNFINPYREYLVEDEHPRSILLQRAAFFTFTIPPM